MLLRALPRLSREGEGRQEQRAPRLRPFTDLEVKALVYGDSNEVRTREEREDELLPEENGYRIEETYEVIE